MLELIEQIHKTMREQFEKNPDEMQNTYFINIFEEDFIDCSYMKKEKLFVVDKKIKMTQNGTIRSYISKNHIFYSI